MEIPSGFPDFCIKKITGLGAQEAPEWLQAGT